MKTILIILLTLTGCAGAESEGIKVQKDITYIELAPHKDQKLDVYSPLNSLGKAPVLIHIHGGGWRIGDKSRTEDHGNYFARNGIVFVTLNYRLSPKFKHPSHIEDCAAGVAWLMKNIDIIGGDKNKVFLSGHSAGAPLAALLATNAKFLAKHNLDPNVFSAVIPVDSASYDFLSNNSERIVAGMIKSAFGTDKDILREASPYHHLMSGSKYPVFHVFVTNERDKAVKNSKDFVDKINSVDGTAKLYRIDKHSHREMNLGMYDPLDPVGREFIRILQK